MKGGGGKGYDRNNNTAMIADVMGAEEYGDEFDNQGEFKREEEGEYDFMWRHNLLQISLNNFEWITNCGKLEMPRVHANFIKRSVCLHSK